MSDFEKLINASDLIEWIIETYPDWCVGTVRSIIDHVEELPSAQPTQTNTFKALETLDCISRQAAIDIERNASVDTNPSHFEAHQKFIQFMDDAEISSFGRWQWSNGFNTALTAVGIDLKHLTSAQPKTPPYVAEIESEYKKWVSMPHIKKPLAKALYEVWKKHDRGDGEQG